MSTLAAITYGLRADGQRSPVAPSIGDAMHALVVAADHETATAQTVVHELRRLAACASTRSIEGAGEALVLARRAREALDAARASTLDAERVYATALAHAAASGEVEP